MVDRHHRRVHADADLAGIDVTLDDAEQLDDVAEAVCDGDLGTGDAADALVVHVAGDDLGAEGDRGDDRRLRSGVEALDVGGRVALGEPEALRLGERRGVVGLSPTGDGVGHLREDEVGGAVDDAEHAADRFAVQALAERPHDRDATGDGRFEQQVTPGRVGRRVQLGTDVGEQLLVGRDDRLAVRERIEDQLAGRLDAADRFDDEVDVRIGHHRVDVTGEHAVGELDVAGRRQVAHGDPGDLEAQAGAALDGGRLRLDELHECSPHVPASENPDPYRLAVARHAGGGYGVRPCRRLPIPPRAQSTAPAPQTTFALRFG